MAEVSRGGGLVPPDEHGWLTPDSFHLVPRVDGVLLSPDGRWLVQLVRRPSLDGRRYVGQLLWMPANLNPGFALTRAEHDVSDAAFLPDGSLVFIEGNDLWLLRTHWLERTQEGPPQHLRPPGRDYWQWLLRTQEEKRPRHLLELPGRVEALASAREAPVLALAVRDESPFARGERRLLRVRVDVAAGRADVEPNVMPGAVLEDARFPNPALTPEGSLVYAWPRPMGRLLYEMDLLVEGRQTPLASGLDYRLLKVSPDGEWVLALGDDWPTPDRAPRSHVQLIERASGRVRELASGLDWSPVEGVWSPDGQSVYVTADEDGYRQIFAIDVGSGEVARLSSIDPLDDGSLSSLQPAPDGGLYAVRTALLEPPHPVRVNGESGAVMRLPVPEISQLDALPDPVIERVKPANTNGARGWLLLPRQASAAEPAPLLVLLRDGPSSGWNQEWYWEQSPGVFAGRFWAVLIVDPGRRDLGFESAIGACVDDILALTTEAQRRDEVDGKRAALWGQRGGAYLANMIAGRPDSPFRAIVTEAGVWDWGLHVGTTEFPGDWLRGIGHPQDHARRYEELSPATSVDQIRAPTLIIHNTDDEEVRVTQSLMMRRQLLSRDPAAPDDSGLLVFEKEGRALSRPANVRQRLETVVPALENGVAHVAWPRPWTRRPQPLLAEEAEAAPRPRNAPPTPPLPPIPPPPGRAPARDEDNLRRAMDTLHVDRVVAARLSPKGERLVLTVEEPVADGPPRRQLWEVRTDDRSALARPLTGDELDVACAEFLHNGWLVLAAGHDLWLVPPDGGEAVHLQTMPGPVESLATAGRAPVVAVTVAVPRPEEEAGATGVLYEGHDKTRDWNRWLNRDWRVYRIRVDVDRKRMDWLQSLTPARGQEDLAAGPDFRFQHAQPALSSDGSLVLASRWQPTDAIRGRFGMVLLEGDAAFTTLQGDGPLLDFDVSGPGDHGSSFSPDDRYVLVPADSLSTPAVPLQRRLLVFDTRTGQGRDLPVGDRWPEEAVWFLEPEEDGPDRLWVYFTADDHGRRPVFRLPLDGGEVTPVPGTEEGTFSSIRVAPDGTLYALQSTLRSPPQPVRVVDGSLTRLSAPGGFEMSVRVGEVAATAGDGVEVRGYVVLPPDASTANPVPLAVWVHGGPHVSWTDGWEWLRPPAFLALKRRCAVLLPDPAGSTGYGQDFIRRGWRDYSDTAAEDVVAITKVAQGRPDIDGSRTAIIGTSFGAFVVNSSLVHHPDLYQAGVSHAGFASPKLYYWTSDIAWGRWGSPATRPDWYEAHSLDRLVDRVRAPLRVTSGLRDQRVPADLGRLWWRQLRMREGGPPADSEGQFFPDSDHYVRSGGEARIWWWDLLGFVHLGLQSGGDRTSDLGSEEHTPENDGPQDQAPRDEAGPGSPPEHSIADWADPGLVPPAAPLRGPDEEEPGRIQPVGPPLGPVRVGPSRKALPLGPSLDGPGRVPWRAGPHDALAATAALAPPGHPSGPHDATVTVGPLQMGDAELVDWLTGPGSRWVASTAARIWIPLPSRVSGPAVRDLLRGVDLASGMPGRETDRGQVGMGLIQITAQAPEWLMAVWTEADEARRLELRRVWNRAVHPVVGRLATADDYVGVQVVDGPRPAAPDAGTGEPLEARVVLVCRLNGQGVPRPLGPGDWSLIFGHAGALQAEAKAELAGMLERQGSRIGVRRGGREIATVPALPGPVARSDQLNTPQEPASEPEPREPGPGVVSGPWAAPGLDLAQVANAEVGRWASEVVPDGPVGGHDSVGGPVPPGLGTSSPAPIAYSTGPWPGGRPADVVARHRLIGVLRELYRSRQMDPDDARGSPPVNAGRGPGGPDGPRGPRGPGATADGPGDDGDDRYESWRAWLRRSLERLRGRWRHEGSPEAPYEQARSALIEHQLIRRGTLGELPSDPELEALDIMERAALEWALGRAPMPRQEANAKADAARRAVRVLHLARALGATEEVEARVGDLESRVTAVNARLEEMLEPAHEQLEGYDWYVLARSVRVQHFQMFKQEWDKLLGELERLQQVENAVEIAMRQLLMELERTAGLYADPSQLEADWQWLRSLDEPDLAGVQQLQDRIDRLRSERETLRRNLGEPSPGQHEPDGADSDGDTSRSDDTDLGGGDSSTNALLEPGQGQRTPEPGLGQPTESVRPEPGSEPALSGLPWAGQPLVVEAGSYDPLWPAAWPGLDEPGQRETARQGPDRRARGNEIEAGAPEPGLPAPPGVPVPQPALPRVVAATPGGWMPAPRSDGKERDPAQAARVGPVEVEIFLTPAGPAQEELDLRPPDSDKPDQDFPAEPDTRPLPGVPALPGVQPLPSNRPPPPPGPDPQPVPDTAPAAPDAQPGAPGVGPASVPDPNPAGPWHPWRLAEPLQAQTGQAQELLPAQSLQALARELLARRGRQAKPGEVEALVRRLEQLKARRRERTRSVATREEAPVVPAPAQVKPAEVAPAESGTAANERALGARTGVERSRANFERVMEQLARPPQPEPSLPPEPILAEVPGQLPPQFPEIKGPGREQARNHLEQRTRTMRVARIEKLELAQRGLADAMRAARVLVEASPAAHPRGQSVAGPVRPVLGTRPPSRASVRYVIPGPNQAPSGVRSPELAGSDLARAAAREVHRSLLWLAERPGKSAAVMAALEKPRANGDRGGSQRGSGPDAGEGRAPAMAGTAGSAGARSARAAGLAGRS